MCDISQEKNNRNKNGKKKHFFKKEMCKLYSVSVHIIAALFSVLLSPIDCSLRNMSVVEI